MPVQVINNMFRLYRARKEDDSSWKKPTGEIQSSLRLFDKELIQRGTSFFGGIRAVTSAHDVYLTNHVSGHKPGMLDYIIWPWMERLPALSLLTHGAVIISPFRMPVLVSICEFVQSGISLFTNPVLIQAKWFNDMKEDDAVVESYISPENHCRFLQGYLSGSPDYDMELA